MITKSASEDLERRLVDHVTRGKLLDLAITGPVDEAAMRTWDDARTIKATVLRDILRGRLAPDPDPHGLRLRGARIDGRLDLVNLTTGLIVALYDCLLEEGLVARDATLPRLILSGCRLKHPTESPLAADRLTAAVLALDRAVVTAHCETGAVELPAAHLGQLNCTRATLRNDAGPALVADGLQVDQTASLRDGFEAVGAGEAGAVRLVGAHVHGQLDCTNATIRNDAGPALVAHGLKVDQKVLLDQCQLVGAGDNETLNLLDVRVAGVLVFDPKPLENTTNSQARLALDGLTYTGLPLDSTKRPQGISVDHWLDLLRKATPSYAAQPYQYFASAHRASGNDSEVRKILMAQRRDQVARGELQLRDRAWAWLTRHTLGYGYQPWRALIALVIVAAIAVVLALFLGAHGGVARPGPYPPTGTRCSVVEQIGVGLDLGLPLIKTGIRDHCDTTASTTGQVLTAAGWGLQLLAWGFATLFVAGFTGIVRKT
jgi:hypothetical protein